MMTFERKWRMCGNYVIGLSLVMLTMACNGNNTENEVAEEDVPEQAIKKYDSIHYIKDRGFDAGIHILGTDSSNPNTQNILFPYGEKSTSTIWRMAEWGSAKPLTDLEPVQSGDTLTFGNAAKRIRFIKDENDEYPQFILELMASQDYTSVRQEGEDWPHLLMEQAVEENTPLEELDSLIVKMDVSLLYDEIKMDKEDFDEGLHTSQVSFYMTISDGEDFLWFGIPVYDYRYPDEIAEYAAQDLGKEDASKKFIMRIASSELFPKSLQQTKNVDIDSDILPYVKNAFEKAQASGYLKNAVWSDMHITSFNFGWETTGTFDSGLLVKELTLFGLQANAHND